MFAMPNRQMFNPMMGGGYGFNPMMGGGYGFNPVARPGMRRGPGVQPGNIPFMGMGGGYPSIAYRGPMPTSSRYGAPSPRFGDFSGIVGLMAQQAARAAATANNQLGAGFGDMSQAQNAQGDAMRQAQQQAGSAFPQQIMMAPMGGTSTADIANQERMQQPSSRGAFASGKSGGGKGGGIGDMMNVGTSPQLMNAYAAPMGGFFR